MGYVNTVAREVNLKIAYYGTDIALIKSSADYIYSVTAPEKRSKIAHIPLSEERGQVTMFDFLPETQLVFQNRLKVRVHLHYLSLYPLKDSSRQRLLQNADGVVYSALATGATDAYHQEDWAELHQQLERLQRDVPVVLQYQMSAQPPEGSFAQLQGLQPVAFAEVAIAADGQGILDAIEVLVQKMAAEYVEVAG